MARPTLADLSPEDRAAYLALPEVQAALDEDRLQHRAERQAVTDAVVQRGRRKVSRRLRRRDHGRARRLRTSPPAGLSQRSRDLCTRTRAPRRTAARRPRGRRAAGTRAGPRDASGGSEPGEPAGPPTPRGLERGA